MTEYTIGQRIQALTLLAHGISYAIIEELIDIKKRALQQIRKNLVDRHGYDPLVNRHIEVNMVQDLPRSGRPITSTTPEISEAVLKTVRDSPVGREITNDQLDYLHNILRTSVKCILNGADLKKVKPS